MARVRVGDHVVARHARPWGSTVPADIGACAMTDLAGDMVALVGALGESRAYIVGTIGACPGQ